MVARRAHNPKVVGSNPAPATKFCHVLHSWRTVAVKSGNQGPVGKPRFENRGFLYLRFTLGIVVFVTELGYLGPFFIYGGSYWLR